MSDKIVHTTDASFETDVINAEKPVLIDFWAEWCSPCKFIAPLLDEAADEYADRLSIVKLDIEHNPVIAQRYRVQSIPTLMIFKDGQPVAMMAGAQPKSSIKQWIERNI